MNHSKRITVNMYQIINNRFIPICCEGMVLKIQLPFCVTKKRISLKSCCDAGSIMVQNPLQQKIRIQGLN